MRNILSYNAIENDGDTQLKVADKPEQQYILTLHSDQKNLVKSHKRDIQEPIQNLKRNTSSIYYYYYYSNKNKTKQKGVK